MVYKLDGHFEMLFDFKATSSKLAYYSYVENVDLRVVSKEMVNLDLPNVDQWKTVEHFGKKQIKVTPVKIRRSWRV